MALQRLGVAPGDRVVYIAPNTYANLESFYAVPQIGAVLVPVNYRLIDSVAQAAIVQCDSERLSQAQLDCLLSVTEWANVREIGACDAIKAKHPSWLRGI